MGQYISERTYMNLYDAWYTASLMFSSDINSSHKCLYVFILSYPFLTAFLVISIFRVGAYAPTQDIKTIITNSRLSKANFTKG